MCSLLVVFVIVVDVGGNGRGVDVGVIACAF